MRIAGIEPQIFEPYLAFVEGTRGMGRDAFQSSLREFFLQFEGVANRRSASHPKSALSDYWTATVFSDSGPS
jgi:hypothetical protein